MAFVKTIKRSRLAGFFPVKTAIAVLFCLAFAAAAGASMQPVVPAGDWYDTSGNIIYATEGGIIKYNGLYYLWGMDRSANNPTFTGVNLYSSPDLKNWTFVNKILKSTSNALLGGGATIERAKILYNSSTNQFVMWMHYEDHNAYSVAEVAYATCATIGGDYTFQSHFRPMNLDSRDLNVYQDTDGKAYLICTTLGNQNVSLFLLDASYTSVVSEVFRGAASNNMACEGHAIIKSGGYYFWIMSWCSGWDFNDNHYYYATSLAGPWTSGGNIATANAHTYESQVGWAFQVTGTAGSTFVFMGDRWSVNNFSMSRMVMLPITVNGTTLQMPWYDRWSIDTQTGAWQSGPQITWNGPCKIINRHSGKVLDVAGYSTADSAVVDQYADNGGSNQKWTITNLGGSDYRITSVNSGKVLDINSAGRDVGSPAIQYTSNGGYNQKWHIIDSSAGAGAYYRLVNVNTMCKALEIAGGSTTDGIQATLGNFNYSDYQEWQIVPDNPPTATPVVPGGPTATRTPITTPTRTPTPGAGQCWNLVWSDEFNGSSINTANWNFETGCTGWGNGELENYTNSAANSYIQGGDLVIQAVNTGGGSCGYTSARMTTKNKVHFTYGRIEARIKCPYGQGIWPAFWMLGSDIDTVSWPACGEIDILEMIGGGTGRDNVCYGTAHWDNGGGQSAGGQHSIAWPAKLSDDYHIYDMEWDAVSIKFFMDGVNYSTVNTTGAGMEEFQEKDFFILLNCAVGGTWPGSPDGTTIFPQMMNVDYVRWYQLQACAVSPTVTPTASRTPSPSASATATADASATASSVPSPVSSVTFTATVTSTFTPSASRTVTAGFTATRTATCACTGSFTATRTATIPNPTNTFTPTDTITRTMTPTPVNTVTMTFTRTRSASATASMSPSATASVSPTNTYTRTLTPSPLPSVTCTGTLTPNPLSPTPTITSTPATAWGKTLTIDSAVSYPNPYAGTGNLNIRITISKPASDLKVRIYSAAFRRILEIPAGSGNSRDVIITVPQLSLSRLAAGIYYIVVIGRTAGNEQAISHPMILVIMK